MATPEERRARVLEANRRQQALLDTIVTSPDRQSGVPTLNLNYPMSSSSAGGSSSSDGVPMANWKEQQQPADSNQVFGPNTVAVGMNPTPHSSSKGPEVQPQKPVAPAQKHAPTPATSGGSARATETPPPTVPDKPPQPMVNDAPLDKPANDFEWHQNLSTPQQQSVEPSEKPEPDRYQSIYGLLFGNEPYEEGKKWISYMEHGMQSPVNDNTMLQRNVANELKMLNDREQAQQTAEQQRMFKNERAQVAYMGQILGQRDKLMKAWQKGEFNDTPELTLDALKQFDNLDKVLVSLGYPEQALWKPSEAPGGFSTAFKKEVTEPTNTAIKMSQWMKTIYDNINTYGANWLNSAQATETFDKLGEFAILREADSKGAIADAEKVRIQIESMPDAERNLYNNVLKTLLMSGKSLQALGLVGKMDESGRASLAEIQRMMNGLSDYDEKNPQSKKDAQQKFLQALSGDLAKGKKSHLANATMAMFLAFKNSGQNVPDDLNSAMNSMKNGFDAYKQYLLESAPTNKALIWNIARKINRESRQKAEYWNRRGGHISGIGIDDKLWDPESLGEAFPQWLEQWQAQRGAIDPLLGETVSVGRGLSQPVNFGFTGNYGANR